VVVVAAAAGEGAPRPPRVTAFLALVEADRVGPAVADAEVEALSEFVVAEPASPVSANATAVPLTTATPKPSVTAPAPSQA
jgi:hypothetical protein